MCVHSYNGLPLNVYCKENGLDYGHICRRMYEIKRNKEFCNYSYDQLLKMIIENNYKRRILTYEGMSLNRYCKLNDLSINTIRSRISALKKAYKCNEYSMEQILDMAINMEKKIQYKGMNLHKYCILNNINYDSVYARMKTISKNQQYKELSQEQIIEKAIKGAQEGKKRYIYKNIPLAEYCLKNKLNYGEVIRNMKIYKSKEEFKRYDNEQLFEMVINLIEKRNKIR